MFERFKTTIRSTAQSRLEIGLITIALLLAGEAAVYMIYVAGHLSGLIEW